MYGYTDHQYGAKLARIRELAAIVAQAQNEISGLVVECRAEARSWNNYGVPSWEDIGQALGVTKQSAQRKYAPIIDATPPKARRRRTPRALIEILRDDGVCSCPVLSTGVTVRSVVCPTHGD